MRQSVSLVRDGRLVAVKYLRVRKYFKGSYQLQSCPPSPPVKLNTSWKREENFSLYYIFVLFRAERLKNILGQILSLFGRHDNCAGA